VCRQCKRRIAGEEMLGEVLQRLVSAMRMIDERPAEVQDRLCRLGTGRAI
jgi:hypothetical protein